MKNDRTPTMIDRRSLLKAGSAMAVLGAMGGTVALAEDAAAPAQGGTITHALASFPTNLASFLSTGTPQNTVCPKIFEGLIAYDFDIKPMPALAESWEMSPDGLTYTFKLRSGVKWHDGQDFSSADVAFSIATLKEVHPRGRNTFSTVTAVETPDATTAIFKLSAPKPFLLAALAGSETPMIPKHLYEGTDLKENPHNNNPVGTGPFKFNSWEVGNYIILDKNPDYWDKPKPYVDRVIFRTFTDIGSRVVGLESGEVDLASSEVVPIADLARLAAMEHLAVNDNGFAYVPTIANLHFNLMRKEFADKRVRQAVAYMIDREFVAKALWYGRAIPNYGPFSPLSKQWYATDLPTYPNDQAKAEALLDEAGFPKDGSGKRFSVTLDFYPDEPAYRTEVEYVKQQLGKVGIEVTIRSQDVSAYVKRIFTDHDFDFTADGYSTQFDPAVGVQRYYYSPLYNKGIPFVNPLGYNNPEVDKLLEDASIEVDEKKRYDLYYKFQHIIADELPVLPLVGPVKFAVYNKRVQDAIVTSNGVFGTLANAHIVG
ncbi:MAG: ABC transporter substrate-binding protein [Rhizobiaceae bacterium]|nr:ABC transporter substrate-binding protein [Rhizobiaceae bacterium]